MKKMEAEDNINQKNINDKWLDNIYEILIRLEGYERLANEGCNSLMEYLQSIAQNPNIDFATLQKKNYDMFITEFEILLNNVRHLVDSKTFLKMRIKLNSLIASEDEAGGFLDMRVDMIQHTEWYVLKPEFYNAQRQISELRGLAVNSLWKLLSPSAKENLEGMPQ